MPKLEIEWACADHDIDDAYATAIADFVMPLLDKHDPVINGSLAYDPYADKGEQR